MKLLGMDTTGQSMSAAVCDGDRLLAEVYTDNGLKHSRTLMSAVDYVLKAAGLEAAELDGIAVAAGPGSFTGIRIGTAAASALAYAAEKPVYAVDTLDALLMNAAPAEVACALMDARREEVYAKAVHGSEVAVPECAGPLTGVLEALAPYGTVLFCGDGALRYRDKILEMKPESRFLGEQSILQHASAVCRCAARGIAVKTDHDGLKPKYLRESQAERLRKSGASGKTDK